MSATVLTSAPLMARLMRGLSVFALLSLLTACASNTGPVVIREAGTAPASTNVPQRSEKPSVSSTPVPSTSVPSTSATPPTVRPVASSKASSQVGSPLKQQLLTQSEQKVSEKDFRSAVVLAERGLRIDRKEPRFYQVLAQAYSGLDDEAQSAYFAQQGLRYASKGTAVYRNLQDLAQ